MSLLQKTFDALKTGIHTLSPACREASRLQSEALDGTLTSSKRFGLRLHLLLCKGCRRYGKQIQFLGSAAHEHTDEMVEAVPQSLSPEARERIKRALDIKSP